MGTDPTSTGPTGVDPPWRDRGGTRTTAGFVVFTAAVASIVGVVIAPQIVFTPLVSGASVLVTNLLATRIGRGGAGAVPEDARPSTAVVLI